MEAVILGGLALGALYLATEGNGSKSGASVNPAAAAAAKKEQNQDELLALSMSRVPYEPKGADSSVPFEQWGKGSYTGFYRTNGCNSDYLSGAGLSESLLSKQVQNQTDWMNPVGLFPAQPEFAEHGMNFAKNAAGSYDFLGDSLFEMPVSLTQVGHGKQLHYLATALQGEPPLGTLKDPMPMGASIPAFRPYLDPFQPVNFYGRQ